MTTPFRFYPAIFYTFQALEYQVIGMKIDGKG